MVRSLVAAGSEGFSAGLWEFAAGSSENTAGSRGFSAHSPKVAAD